MWVFPEISDEAVAVSTESLEVGRVVICAVIVYVVHIQLAWVNRIQLAWVNRNKSAAFAAILAMLAVLLSCPQPAYTSFLHCQFLVG